MQRGDKEICHSREELQRDADERLHEYNEQMPRSGKHCCGKTTMQTLLDSLPPAKEKVIESTLQTASVN
ncbi:MAG: hypothetical protein HY265_06190 [Deltaproteobacteria bacterium]|nr:hypothetical protein [Deltaproteobacteria bacterium]MBI3755730.1 hypothetical protein [Deltaproteobacteria bacterium]